MTIWGKFRIVSASEQILSMTELTFHCHWACQFSCKLYSFQRASYSSPCNTCIFICDTWYGRCWISQKKKKVLIGIFAKDSFWLPKKTIWQCFVVQMILQETLRGKHFGIQRKSLPLEPSLLLREANRRRASLSAGNMFEMFEGRPIISDGYWNNALILCKCIFGVFGFQVFILAVCTLADQVQMHP